MGGFVERDKNRAKGADRLIGLIKLGLLLLTLTLTVLAPLKGFTQDDMPVSDDELAVPGNTGTSSPPVMIDEGDSGSVSDVEEYDG